MTNKEFENYRFSIKTQVNFDQKYEDCIEDIWELVEEVDFRDKCVVTSYGKRMHISKIKNIRESFFYPRLTNRNIAFMDYKPKPEVDWNETFGMHPSDPTAEIEPSEIALIEIKGISSNVTLARKINEIINYLYRTSEYEESKKRNIVH
jgi:hypothetical protein